MIDIENGIIIHWTHSTEFIEFDSKKPEQLLSIRYSIEYWPEDAKRIKYNIKPEVVQTSESSYRIKICYRKEMNPDLLNEDIPWGEATIYIEKDSVEGKVEWKDYENVKHCGEVKWYRFDMPIKGAHRRITTTRLQRRQAEFRKLLLTLDDGKCVLTRESTHEVLEAAHIISVKDGGTESPKNGILLRSDLHRLYDAGKFKISETGRIVEVVKDELSTYYTKLLKSKKIKSSSLKRIRQALVEK